MSLIGAWTTICNLKAFRRLENPVIEAIRKQVPATLPSWPRDPGHTALVSLGSDPLIYKTGEKAFSPISQVVKIDQEAKVLCQRLPVEGTS